jgi:hypothetical protein
MKLVPVFTEEDIVLLHKRLPNSPCGKCSLKNGGCCGCEEGRIEQAQIKPYKDNGIYDIACDIARYKHLEDKIKECQDEMAKLKDKIPDVIDLDKVM